ncbi:uncharacterized protein [Clytia hemisphaerica]|uniref:Uncharacterized protein n=1 Tax=Clytia hemisphaerica TaxID=252671 RepID=A0A7M5V4E1_9CNID
MEAPIIEYEFAMTSHHQDSDLYEYEQTVVNEFTPLYEKGLCTPTYVVLEQYNTMPLEDLMAERNYLIQLMQEQRERIRQGDILLTQALENYQPLIEGEEAHETDRDERLHEILPSSFEEDNGLVLEEESYNNPLIEIDNIAFGEEGCEEEIDSSDVFFLNGGEDKKVSHVGTSESNNECFETEIDLKVDVESQSDLTFRKKFFTKKNSCVDHDGQYGAVFIINLFIILIYLSTQVRFYIQNYIYKLYTISYILAVKTDVDRRAKNSDNERLADKDNLPNEAERESTIISNAEDERHQKSDRMRPILYLYFNGIS